MATKKDILDMILRLPDSVNSFGALNNDEFFRQMVAFIDTKKDNVVEVPKWLTYKALLTQSGEDAPVARVLNQDDGDFLGELVWLRNDIGIYSTFVSNPAKNTFIYPEMSSVIIENRTNTEISIIKQPSGSVQLNVKGSYGDLSDSVLNNTYIEIKVRQRGTAPILLSAETNETGDRVILTFDKKMSGYNLDNSIYEFYISGMTNSFALATYMQKDNQIVLFPDNFILSTDVITINFNYNDIYIPESLDYGLLQPFENFPVTNNVVAPE